MGVLTAFGLVATVVFGILTVVLYFKSRRHKRLTFTFDHTELQTRTHPEVKITFRDRPVDNLSRLRVVCWNSGSEEIRWSDIQESSPPQIAFPPDAQVLSVAQVGGTDEIAFHVEQHDERTVSVRFAYLNPADCGFFEVLYENLQRDKPHLEFRARVIGGRPTDSRPFSGPAMPGETLAVTAGVLLWPAMAYMATDLVRGSVLIVGSELQLKIVGIGVLLIFLVGSGLIVWNVWRHIQRRRRSRVPALARNFLSRPNEGLQATAKTGPRLSA